MESKGITVVTNLAIKNVQEKNILDNINHQSKNRDDDEFKNTNKKR